MSLGELIETMVGPARIQITCGGEEVYKGYVGCMEYHDLPLHKRVIGCELGTEIYKIDKSEEQRRYWNKLPRKTGERVPEDEINIFSFSDLEMNIYFRVKLEE